MTGSDLILAIDAGGTFFKYAVLCRNREFVCEIRKESVNSKGTADEILGVYGKIINWAAEHYSIDGIGVATPGPFDYVNCKSLMKHKFESLFGINLKEHIQSFCERPLDVWFMSDTNAFLLGEFYGLRGKYQNVIGVTIGTGLGMSVIKGCKLITNPYGGPAEVIFNLPAVGGILEDIVSGRGISASFSATNYTAADVAELARKGDSLAAQVYEHMGETLGTALKGFVSKYETQAVIIGGQIAKSLDLFGNSVKREVDGVEIIPACDFEGAALRGLCKEGA